MISANLSAYQIYVKLHFAIPNIADPGLKVPQSYSLQTPPVQTSVRSMLVYFCSVFKGNYISDPLCLIHEVREFRCASF